MPAAARSKPAPQDSSRRLPLRAAAAPSAASAEPERGFWTRSTVWLAIAGSLLLWLAFPPCGLWPLAWIAPLPWLVLAQKPVLAGRRPYLGIWLAGFLFWLLILQGIRLAHPALIGGWIALSFYLAFYLPIF